MKNKKGRRIGSLNEALYSSDKDYFQSLRDSFHLQVWDDNCNNGHEITKLEINQPETTSGYTIQLFDILIIKLWVQIESLQSARVISCTTTLCQIKSLLLQKLIYPERRDAHG